jgi:aminopeptidase
MTDFETKLDRLAALAVRVGLNLRAGQEVVMTAPVEALPLVRRIAAHAYQAGAVLVTPLIGDDEVTLARYRHAHPEEAFDTAPGWLFEAMANAFRGGAARLAVVGEDPTLLGGQDPAKVARANKARSIAYRPALELITSFAINWNLVPAATPGWARQVFPALPQEQAVAALWDAIFAACRVDVADPVAEWAAHNRTLHARTAFLNGKERHHLQSEHPDRRSLHDAAQAARRRRGALDQAAGLSGHADRGHRRALRSRVHRGGECLEGCGGAAQGSGDG